MSGADDLEAVLADALPACRFDDEPTVDGLIILSGVYDLRKLAAIVAAHFTQSEAQPGATKGPNELPDHR